VNRILIGILLPLLVSCARGGGNERVPGGKPWSARIAESFLARHPGAVTNDSGSTVRKWTYEQGVMLWALHQMAIHTGDARYARFITENLDQYVQQDGRIRSYSVTDYNLDLIAPGRALLVAYETTGQKKYRLAADTLRRQLHEQPRTHEGGFWHKKIYPYQMWLDGLYMAEPFYALYARMFNEPGAYDDIADQFIRVIRRAGCTITAGMRAGRSAGQARQRDARRASGEGPSGGMRWDLWMCWTMFRPGTPNAKH